MVSYKQENCTKTSYIVYAYSACVFIIIVCTWKVYKVPCLYLNCLAQIKKYVLTNVAVHSEVMLDSTPTNDFGSLIVVWGDSVSSPQMIISTTFAKFYKAACV